MTVEGGPWWRRAVRFVKPERSKATQRDVLVLILFVSIGTLISTLRLSTVDFSIHTHNTAFALDVNPHGSQVCRIQPYDAEFAPASQNAFAVVTQTTLPRAYHIGFESFLKNNPEATLYVYGNLEKVDARFGQRVVGVKLNLTDVQRQLIDALPELDQAVFQTEIWRQQILPSIESSPMMLSDFMRLSLLFLYGGSWLDADAIYLRPFTMRNALPCHEQITSGRGYFWIQCEPDGSLHMPFDDTMAVIPGQSFYCTNGIMGQFAARHPFLRKALLQMVSLYPDLVFNPGLKSVALGGHLFVSTMITTNVTESSLRLSEWPLMYHLNQMFGFWGSGAGYLHDNVTAMLEDLERRRVFSVQLYHWLYQDADALRNYFQPGKLHYELWQRNCQFSCNEPVT